MVWYVVNQYEEVVAGPYKRVQDARVCARNWLAELDGKVRFYILRVD